jgi:protein-tyrosine-phosphatase
MNEPLILIIGGADVGRAPMAAAMLRRLLRGAGVRVESAGVVGHDGAEAEPEARDTMLAMGLSIDGHTARSLTDELAAEARVLLAVDTGVARVLLARYPEAQVATLGGLAGRARDIPDPFRMQVGAWLHYAREIETMLGAGLPRLQAMLEGRTAPDEPAPPPPAVTQPPPAPSPQAGGRLAAVERVARLLSLVVELPAVVAWESASQQIAADLGAMEQPLAPGDFARPYVALVRTMLGATPPVPGAAQAAALRTAVTRLRAPISPADLEAVTAELDGYSALH